MKKLAVFLLASYIAAAQPSLPRLAPALHLLDANGMAMHTPLKGGVAVVLFISTHCSHCQAVTHNLEPLYVELKDRGLRMIAAAFDEGADAAAFAKTYGLTYPVGLVNRTTVLAFLGIPNDVRLGTPQIVVIDRKGMVRAQSETLGSPLLQQPEVLRSIVTKLLGER